MQTETRQPLWRKIAYGGGSFGAGVAGQVIGFYLLYFYVTKMGLPLKYYQLGMVIYAIWNAINDPLAGHISDRTKSRWGRRIPYIRFLSLPFAVSFALVFTPPASLSQFGLFLYFVAMLFIFDTLFTFVVLNWTALFPEMYPSLEERSQVSAIRQIMAIISLVVGVALAPMLYSSIGWTNMAVVFAVLIAIGMYVSLLGSKERPESHGGESLPLGPALRFTFSNPSFVTAVLVSFLVQFCFGVMEATMPLYAQFVLGLPDAQVTLLWAAVFGSALVMFFVWPMITNRLGTRKAIMMGIILFALGLIPFTFLTTLKGALIFLPFMGIGLAGLMMLIDILLAEVMDEDQIRTGTRREGMYFGVNGFVVRLSIALQGIIIANVLAWGHYVEGSTAQPAEALTALRVLMTWVPWVGLALGLVVIYLHKLHGARLADVQAKLAQSQAKPAGD